MARTLSEDGRWRQAADALAPTDSLMTHCADPLGVPELLHLRERMRAWRFYDQLRVDRDAPARRPQVGTHIPVLAGDGANLAAALQTVREIGDARALDDVFPGGAITVADSDELEGPRLVSAAARRHGITRSQLMAWRRALKIERTASDPIPTPAFVPAVVVPEPPLQAKAAPRRRTPRQAAPGRMVIEVRRGRRVVVDGAVDAEALARVLDVLDPR